VQDALEYVRQLAARDHEVASELELLAGLEADAEAIRGRASELVGFFAALPQRREQLEEHRAAAQAELDQRRQALTDARAELAHAEARGSAERIDAARRTVARAEKAVEDGDARIARVAAERAELEAAALAAERELPELLVRARGVAERLRDAPRVRDSFEPGDDLVEWGGRVRAALFLARTGLEREREQVVREAVELGTAALGEPVYGSTVAAVRKRLEEASATS
jgi:chromosome segregation ATPase